MAQNIVTVMGAADGNWAVVLNGRRFVFSGQSEAESFAQQHQYESFEQEWERDLRGIVVTARELVNTVLIMSADSQANNLSALIAATPSGEYIGVSTLVRDHAENVLAVFTSLLTWLETPIPSEDDYVVPAIVLRERF